MVEDNVSQNFIDYYSNFIKEGIFEDIKGSVASTDGVLRIKNIIADYEDALKTIQKEIEEVEKVIKVQSFSSRLKSRKLTKSKDYPTSVRNLYLISAISIASVIGTAAFFATGSFFGVLNPAYWSTSLILTSSILGLSAAAPSGFFINKKFKRNYETARKENKKLPFGTRRLTRKANLKYVQESSQQMYDVTVLNFQNYINSLLNGKEDPSQMSFLNENGGLSSEFSYLSPSDKKELLDRIATIRGSQAKILSYYESTLKPLYDRHKSQQDNIQTATVGETQQTVTVVEEKPVKTEKQTKGKAKRK